jgi:hypothetical protein
LSMTEPSASLTQKQEIMPIDTFAYTLGLVAAQWKFPALLVPLVHSLFSERETHVTQTHLLTNEGFFVYL